MKNGKLREFIRFCFVGVVCTAIDAIVFLLFHGIVGYRIAIVTGFILSFGLNYLLNISWSFNVRQSKKNACGFIAAHLFNIFVVRWGLMFIFVDLGEINETIAYMTTLVFSVISNFFIIRFILHTHE